MATRLFSSIGQVYEVQVAYADLAAFDKSRKERASATRDAVQALHAVSREPIRQRFYDILVPLQN
ncbi:MAG: hypothetical protein JO352_14535 [Chloroflexi bacterium]|nr:hypothetical protein [Chloroflexota bacterium]